MGGEFVPAFCVCGGGGLSVPTPFFFAAEQKGREHAQRAVRKKQEGRNNFAHGLSGVQTSNSHSLRKKDAEQTQQRTQTATTLLSFGRVIFQPVVTPAQLIQHVLATNPARAQRASY